MYSHKFEVRVLHEDPINMKDLAAFIKDAVETWGGQYQPDHPMFPSNYKSVIVLTQGRTAK